MSFSFSSQLRHRLFVFFAFLTVAGFFEIATISSEVAASWKDTIGYSDLVAELTAASVTVPTGAGVSIMQVEAIYNGGYRPTASSSEYSGVTFTYGGLAGTNTNVSGHADLVGKYIYGTSSITDGITDVTIYDANSWADTYLNPNFTNGRTTGSTTTYTLSSITSLSADVVNCSFVSSSTSTSDTSTLQLLDYSINKNDYVCVVGVNNGSTTSLPTLLSQSYNAISVGCADGDHSHGVTTINGAGRTKPDIVAPASTTSEATAMVSSASAFLLSAADNLGSDSTAYHSQTIKAILMAGATRNASNWSHASTSPLDTTYGAGTLNIARSYAILAGGKQSAGSTISNTGWDYNSIAASSTVGSPGSTSTSSTAEKAYYFSVDSGTKLTELSALLNWNATVTGTATAVTSTGSTMTTYAYTTSLTDLDLYLYEIISGSLSLVAYSASTVDNTELIYLTELDAGDYVLKVVSTNTTSTAYALAWYMTSVAVPEPGSMALLLAAGVTATVIHRRRRRNSLVGQVLRT